MTYETRVIKLCVAPKGEPLFSEQATMVEIVDEVAGEYLEITQCPGQPKEGTIFVGAEEWPALKAAIETLLKDCRENK